MDFDPGDFLAIAVYSDMEQTGQFECSNPDINRLLENTRWSMKGNFLDVPTDCPTREIAEVIGNEPDARLFAEYATGAKNAYEYLFLQGSSVDTDRQAKLVRPLALGLADGATRTALQERLVRAVENRGYRIGTGFLSTPFVLPVLTDAGRADVAYRMIENEEPPSWLGEVKAGATTVWEDWEGKASHNHYSPGAVCRWLFDTVAGIRVTGE